MRIIQTDPEVWGEHSWDDFVSKYERKELSKLNLGNRDDMCPYLRRKGKTLFYCDVLSDNYSFLGLLTVDNVPDLCSPELHARRFAKDIRDLCTGCFNECDRFQEGQILEQKIEERMQNREGSSRDKEDIPF